MGSVGGYSTNLLFSNLAKSTLAGPITNVATTAQLASGTGALYPAPTAGHGFVGTFIDAATGLLNEVVLVTGMSGDQITAMTRAQENTSALNWNAGDFFYMLGTAGTQATFLQLATAIPAVVGTMSGLVGAGTASAKTASWTVNELILETILGGITYKGTSLSLAFNGATVGVNGMDTGSMPSGADLSIYAIYNPTSTLFGTLGTLGATSNGPIYTGANMPAGYTASCLIWAGVTTGVDFIQFYQFGRKVWIAETSIASGLSGGPTLQSLAVAVPAAATTFFPIVQLTGASQGEILLSPVTPSIVSLQYGVAVLNTSSSLPECPIVTSQDTYYSVSGAGATFNLAINGYTF